MSASKMELALWAVAVALAAIGVASALHAATGGDSVSPRALPAGRSLAAQAAALPGPGEIVDHDVFRLVRRPSPVAYRPELEGVAPPPPPPKLRPPLALSGILGGPPWEALVDGFPGHDASLMVRKGDVVGTLRVRSVSADSVVIAGEDTTWRLGLRRSWP